MTGRALITGASSGIGEAFARIHAALGGDLVLVARRADRLEALKAELEAAHGVAAACIVADLAEEDAPRAIHDAAARLPGGVEILINNAGFGGRGLFHERPWPDDRRMIQVNVVALAALTRLFLDDMVARGAGRILNVSSTAGEMPGPMQAVYFASKAFVTSFTNALAEELDGVGVTATALLPGATRTGFAAASGMERTPLFRNAVSADEVARAGYDAMMRGALSVVAGVPPSRRILYAIAPLLPKRTLMRAVRKTQETALDA